ncbi:hypothetical protein JCM5350_001414 [Sporobolomyces pararoseus]
MKLSDVPSDILLLVLSHLDFPSLSSLVRTHSAFNSVWKSYPEHLSRAICIRNGLADSKTLSAAAPLQAEGWHKRGGLDNEPSQEELEDVIREQRSMSGAFDGVRTWKEYSQVRLCIDRKWKKGMQGGSRLHCDLTGDAEQLADFGFWKFKLDPISNWYIVTGVFGGIFAFDNTGQLVWHSIVPEQRQPHLELTYDNSNSYISVNHGRQAFLVWKLYDPSSSSDTSPSPPQPINLPNYVQASLDNRFHSLDPSGKGFYPYCWFESPSPLQATKLRFPRLICSSEDSRTISVWNIREPQTSRIDTDTGTRFIDQLEEEEVQYLDFDQENVFIAGKKSVVVFRPAISRDGVTRKYQTTWPPSISSQGSLSASSSSTHYRQPSASRTWSAVHHDSKSNHLCAIASRTSTSLSKLLWTCNYSRTIWSENLEEIKQKTVVLVVGCHTLSQLSVENDRASFVAGLHRGDKALITIPLRSFFTLDDFISDPPQVVCTSYPLALFKNPSTIESSSTDIYLPHEIDLSEDSQSHEIAASYTEYSSLWKGFSRSLPFLMRWESLDGRVLKSYEEESVTNSEAKELDELWKKVLGAMSNNIAIPRDVDGIMSY